MSSRKHDAGLQGQPAPALRPASRSSACMYINVHTHDNIDMQAEQEGSCKPSPQRPRQHPDDLLTDSDSEEERDLLPADVDKVQA